MVDIMITKLFPPKIANSVIKRPRLLETLAQAEASRLILLIAPAGYGKTVLITQYLSGSNRPFLWYQLDPYDNDPIVFLNYMLTGIRQHYPNFAQKTLDSNNLQETAVNPRLVATVLINNLAVLAEQGLVLVFDDYHVIQESRIHHLIQELCLHLPSGIQIILASRVNLPVNLSRLGISDDLCVIGADMLRFNHEESISFLKQKGVQISEETNSRLDEMTGGWPVALRLLNGSAVGGLMGPDVKTDEIFSYLASEIFDRQPVEIQEFLKATSILEVMDSEICDRLLERDDSGRIFAILEKQQLFLIPLSGKKKSYRYHQLFREFLLDRLGERRSELRRRAGRLTQSTGKIDQAVEYMIAAGIDCEALTILKKASLQALHQGRWLTVNRWLTQISNEQMISEPWLGFFQAQVLTYRGQLDEAELWTVQAEKGFIANKEQPGVIESQILRARILRCQGCYQRSITLLEESVSNIPPAEAKTRFDIPLERALCLFMTGRLQEAETILCKALERAKSRNDRYLITHLIEGLGNIYYMQGKYPQAMQIFQFGLQLSPDHFLPGYYMQSSIAHIYNDWGQLDRALEFAKRDLNFKESLGLVGTLPSAYHQMAHIYIEIGELDRAYEYLCRGIEIAQQTHGDRYFYILSRSFLGWVCSMQQHWVEARSRAEEAFIDAKEQGGMVYPICEMIFGTILAQTGETEKAQMLLKESVVTLMEMGVRVPLCSAYKALSWLCDQAGAVEEFHGYARNYLELAAKLNYVRNFLPTTYHLLRPILKYGLLEGVEIFFVQRVLVQLGDQALELLEELAVRPGQVIRNRIMPPLVEIGSDTAQRIIQSLDQKACSRANTKKVLQENKPYQDKDSIQLHFQTLGTFRVFCRGEEITAVNWRTTKSRDLLAYLAHQNQPVSTDQILEDLWPNYNSNNASANFHTTLYYLRQTLKCFSEKELIIHGTRRYQLRPGSFFNDRRQFEETARRVIREPATDQVIYQMEEALALYKGDYLNDLDYFWIIPFQEELKNQWFALKRRLACHYLEQRQYSWAITHLHQLMAIQPFSEEILGLLMTALAGMGDYQGAREKYLTFAKTISDELGLSPSPEITAIYNDICR
ncbi:MAG TPA: tetratricopeptide repeat protein [Bacillota bacterium]|nr:tetratricopeptide repeat protein [Bacillota bacterium]